VSIGQPVLVMDFGFGEAPPLPAPGLHAMNKFIVATSRTLILASPPLMQGASGGCSVAVATLHSKDITDAQQAARVATDTDDGNTP
jgi:hypothetical protein